MVIEKSLQRPISVDAHDEQFVQCVSPNPVEFSRPNINRISVFDDYPQQRKNPVSTG